MYKTIRGENCIFGPLLLALVNSTLFIPFIFNQYREREREICMQIKKNPGSSLISSFVRQGPFLPCQSKKTLGRKPQSFVKLSRKIGNGRHRVLAPTLSSSGRSRNEESLVDTLRILVELMRFNTRISRDDKSKSALENIKSHPAEERGARSLALLFLQKKVHNVICWTSRP